MNDQQQAIQELREIIKIEESGPRYRAFGDWSEAWLLKVGARHATPGWPTPCYVDEPKYAAKRVRMAILKALEDRIDVTEEMREGEERALRAEVIWIGKVAS
jgi:hypothetical protein